MSGRPLAENEIRRMLALVPWIVAHPGAAKSDVATRFDITEQQLEADLGLMMMIGVPPYTPDVYIDVEYDGPTVTIRLGDPFLKPLRLTPAEGLALLAAGRTLLAVPGSDPAGPLATALHKLAVALDLPDVAIDIHRPRVLEEAREAASAHERIEIDYWSAGRDDTTTRRIDPATVYFSGGGWYLSAWCHQAGDDRLFRVDRIRSLRHTGETFEPSNAPSDTGEVYKPRDTDARVTLDLPLSARWIAEAYPNESVSESGGRLIVTLAVSEDAWLRRLLLRAGPEARVVEPRSWAGVGAAAAATVLSRYRGGHPARHQQRRE